MVQAVLTTRLSSRWRQQESGHRLCLPLCREEPKSRAVGGLVDGWGSGRLLAPVDTASCLLSLTCLQKALAGLLQAITLFGEQLLHVIRCHVIRRLGGQVFRVWNRTVRDIYFRLWTLFSVSRDWSSLPVPRGALKQGRSKKCLFPQNVLWWSFFTTLHPSDDAALTWMSHFIFKELLPLSPL